MRLELSSQESCGMKKAQRQGWAGPESIQMPHIRVEEYDLRFFPGTTLHGRQKIYQFLVFLKRLL